MPTMPRTDRQRESERAYRARRSDRGRSKYPIPHRAVGRNVPVPVVDDRRLTMVRSFGPYAIVAVRGEGFAWLDARRPVTDGLDAGRYADADAAFESLCRRILATLEGPHP